MDSDDSIALDELDEIGSLFRVYFALEYGIEIAFFGDVWHKELYYKNIILSKNLYLTGFGS